ncbi:hypothetical protein M885DRAFT_464953 [Pelagophyceae sp. CCMP2097]|nr:hypothetical protein M885DRAFT_464953 [Pelagophyceae sp. CCMP2097]
MPMPDDLPPWWDQPIAAQPPIGARELHVEILVAGDGFKYPKAGSTVSVHYVGYLPSGKVFDATYRRGAPFKFKLGQNQVIEGLDAAISQLSQGERAQIRIGSERAFGKRGFPFLVPPSTGLIFDLAFLGSS